jgi:hypothetical protein
LFFKLFCLNFSVSFEVLRNFQITLTKASQRWAALVGKWRLGLGQGA